MTNALETYLHQIGLVADMLLPHSMHTPLDDAVSATEDGAVASKQQQQQPTMIYSTKDASSLPPATTSKSAADGSLLQSSPAVIESSSSSVADSSYLDSVPVAPPIASYSSELSCVHSTITTGCRESDNHSSTVGDSAVSRDPNAVTSVTVGNTPNDPGTLSLHRNPNVTHFSHVASKSDSPPNTRRSVVQCSGNSYSKSRNLPQETNHTSGRLTTAEYTVTQLGLVRVDPYSLAREEYGGIGSSLNFKDITQYTHTNNRTCLVDMSDVEDHLSFEKSPSVTRSNLSRDDNSLVLSIRQNLREILHSDHQPLFDEIQHSRSVLYTTFSGTPTFEDYCSDNQPSSNHCRHLPGADDSKRKEVELQDALLSPSTLSSVDSPSQPLSDKSSNDFSHNQPTLIKSSLKKEAPSPPLQGVRKAVTFSTSDLVHVEEYTLSPATPPHDLFFPFDGRHLEIISEDTDSWLFGSGDYAELWQPPLPPATQENNNPGSWFNSSTDVEPYLVDEFQSPADETIYRDCAPLSIANDVFGRTTIFLTSAGTFRPGESGKLNGKTVSDLNGLYDRPRTLSAGTLSGIRSHRTLVKVNFVQGLLDINHNPGQTAEMDSKAVQDDDSGIFSTLDYCRGIFHENLKNLNIKEFPLEEISSQQRVEQKICHKLSPYKYKLIAAIVCVFILLCLVIGLGVGLSL